MIKKRTKKKPVTKKKNKLRLRASSANQWAKCTGLLDLEKNGNPYDDTSAADFGNVIHKLAEWLFEDQMFLWGNLKYLKVKNFVDYHLDELSAYEMTVFNSRKDDVYNYLEFYYTSIQQDILYFKDAYELEFKDFKFFIEHRMEIEAEGYTMSPIVDFGLSFFFEEHLQIFVYDAKFGYLEVEAKENLQLAIYGNALAKELNLEKKPEVYGKIIQPPIKSKKTTDILTHQKFFNNLYKEPGKRKFITGSQCRYCDYNDVCPYLKKKVKKYLNPSFQDVSISRIDTWPELLTMQKPITKMLDQVKKSAREYMLQGTEIKGYEIAIKNGDRKWIQGANTNLISKKLKLKKADLEVKKTLSPAQTEKLLKESNKSMDEFNDLIYQSDIRYLKQIKGVEK